MTRPMTSGANPYSQVSPGSLVSGSVAMCAVVFAVLSQPEHYAEIAGARLLAMLAGGA